MKISFICLCLVPLALLGQKQSLELDAGLGVGYARYSETGSIRPLKSEWEGATSHFSLGAKVLGKTLVPAFSLGLLSSENAKETWKQNGQLSQENQMSFAGMDIMGALQWPLHPKGVTITPSLGVMARYLFFTREDFVLYNPEGAGFLRVKGEVDEWVKTYGIGGGILLEFPMGESWEISLGSHGYWLFYTFAENDAFDSEIEGENGWIWQASFSLVKNLMKPGQVMGLRILGEIQHITGDIDSRETSFVEWPDNQLEKISAQLYWRREF